MDPISNTDRLVRLLRQQLEQKSKTRQRSNTSDQQPVQQSDRDRVRAIAGNAARAGVDDRHLHRLVVEQLLTEQFGHEMVNEARFQQVLDKVVDIMAEDATISGLLSRVSSELD